MISVIIPTLNASQRLPACLDALVSAAVSGLIKEVIIVDGGSADETVKIAEGFGARVIITGPSRGGQLKAGAAAAMAEWLLFLHADTILEAPWAEESAAFMAENIERASVFTLRLDAKGFAPRLVAAGAMARTRLFKAPYGDQGLLIARTLHDQIGGYGDLPLMEDVDFMRRLITAKGRKGLHVFSAHAITSAERYEREGYVKRVLKNAVTLARYHLGASPATLAEHYRK